MLQLLGKCFICVCKLIVVCSENVFQQNVVFRLYLTLIQCFNHVESYRRLGNVAVRKKET